MVDRQADTSREQLERIAEGYETSTDFDSVISRYAGRLIADKVAGRHVLECGAALGEMTELLLKVADVDVVEAAEHYVRLLRQRFGPRLVIHHSLAEHFNPPCRYDVVVVASLLHHFNRPMDVLRHMRSWVVPGGRLIATVPNMLSMHRRLGVAMGVTDRPDAASSRNIRFGQPGRFDRDSIAHLLHDAGWRMTEIGGFLIKPFPNDLMQSLNLSDNILDGLFELGRQLPELASQIMVTAEVSADPGDGSSPAAHD